MAAAFVFSFAIPAGVARAAEVVLFCLRMGAPGPLTCTLYAL